MVIQHFLTKVFNKRKKHAVNEDEIKKAIRELCKKNRYQDAKILKEKYSEIDLGWIDKKIESACQLEEALAQYISKEQVVARLKDLGFVVEMLDETIMIEDGIINAGCFIHDVNGYQVFEKIFINKVSFERESYLFKKIPSEELGAPKYIGCIKGKDIFSVYYQAIDSRPMPNDVHVLSNRLRLAMKLWLSKFIITPSIQKKASSCRFEKLLKNDKIKGDLSDVFVEKNVADKTLKEMHEIARVSKKVIFHGDFHSGNMLYDGERCFIVDWDKWSFSKVGVGYLMKYRNFEEIGCFHQLIANCSLDINKQIVNNFLLYNVMGWLEKGKTNEVAAYMDFIKKYWVGKLSEMNNSNQCEKK